jgi:hypothetical protein
MEEDVFLKVEGFTLLESNPETGVTTYFRTNADGSTDLYARQDVEPLLEANKAAFFDRHNEKLSDWVPLARFDDLTMQNLEISKRLEQKDTKSLGNILNNSDYAKYRTSSLKV